MTREQKEASVPTFTTTLAQSGNNVGIEVPEEIVLALGAGKRVPVTVQIAGYSYRSTIAVMGGRYLIPLSAAHRASAGEQISIGRHRLTADEPAPIGTDTGPSPYDFLLAGLGACTSMTVRMYAERKKWPLEKVTVSLRHSRIHAQDCSNCETETGQVDRIERIIRFDGDLDDDQRQRLREIADKCPVHRTLHSEIVIDTTVSDDGRVPRDDLDVRVPV